MTDKLTKALREARPTLKMVSPLSHWILVIMAVFNIILSVSLFFAADQGRVSAPLLIVNELFTYKFWAVIFFSIGIIKLYSLYINDWSLSRKTLLLGVSVKAAWAVALIIRVFISPGTIFLALLWITVAFLQMACYIWFMPPSTGKYEQRRINR